VQEDLDRERTSGDVKTDAGKREVPPTPALQAARADWRER
jgi:hypothetical protein